MFRKRLGVKHVNLIHELRRQRSFPPPTVLKLRTGPSQRLTSLTKKAAFENSEFLEGVTSILLKLKVICIMFVKQPNSCQSSEKEQCLQSFLHAIMPFPRGLQVRA